MVSFNLTNSFKASPFPQFFLRLRILLLQFLHKREIKQVVEMSGHSIRVSKQNICTKRKE